MKTSEFFALPPSLSRFAPYFPGEAAPWEWLKKINEALAQADFSAPGAKVPAGVHVEGKVWLHPSVKLPPYAVITGPAWIGAKTEIRPGAFIRGNVIVGEGGVLGNSCEYKNCLLLDGVQTPCVADRCRAIFDRRFLIEESLDEVRAEILALLGELQGEAPAMRWELNDLLIVHPTMTEPEARLVRAMSAAVQDAVGRRPPLIASPGTYDQKHFARIAGVEQCIAYGPGILSLAHQPDEYCEIEHLVLSCKAMAIAALRLLGEAG